MREFLEMVFVLMFIITGCSVDSIFDGGAFVWCASFLITILVAWVLFGGYGE